MWNDLRMKDKVKLLYAYLFTPIWGILSLGGNISSELYRMYGSREALNIPFGLLFRISMTQYLMLALPPTIIRFTCIRHELKYGVEIYCHMLLSFLLTRVATFTLTGTLIPTLGFLDCLMIYCILSFRSTEYYEIPHSHRYGLTFITIGVAFLIIYFTTKQFTANQQYLFPIWEAITLCIVLNSHTDATLPDEQKQASHTSQETTTNQTFAHEGIHINFNPKPPSKAASLVDIGLAHIGRIAKSANQYLTPSQTAARHNVERPFIRLLADRCRDEATRKALARYFMVYKEMTLFVIYVTVLKQNPALHIDVRTKLKERLSEGLLPNVLKKRNALWRELSAKFYEGSTQTHDIAMTLEYVFWSKLPDRFKAGGVAGGEQLREIFEYSREAIAREL